MCITQNCPREVPHTLYSWVRVLERRLVDFGTSGLLFKDGQLPGGSYVPLHSTLLRISGPFRSWRLAKLEGSRQGKWVLKCGPKGFDNLRYLLGQEHLILVCWLLHKKATHLKTTHLFLLSLWGKPQHTRICQLQQHAFWVIHCTYMCWAPSTSQALWQELDV